MSGLKVVVGLAVVAALGFWLGRSTALPLAAPLSSEVVASWDGGVLLKEEVDGWLKVSPSNLRSQTIAELARARMLASVAREEGLDREPLLRRHSDDLLIEALRKAKVPQTPIPEEDLRRTWELDRVRFTQAETVRIAQIQLSADPGRKAMAEKLLKELLAKAERNFYAFSDAAQVHSLDSESKLGGGELPPLTLGDAESRFGKDLVQRLLGLKPGEILPQVVELPNKVLLLRLVEHVPGSVVPFERVRESVRARLSAERAVNAWTTWVTQIERDRGLVLVE